MKNYTADTPINVFRPEVTSEVLREAVERLRPGNLLAPLSSSFVGYSKDWGIDQVYLIAHAALESAWGSSNFAVNRNNLFGYQAYTTDPQQAKVFNSKEECIQFIAKFVSVSYLNPKGKWYGGAPSLRGMNVHYATATHWGESIAKIMAQIDAQIDLILGGVPATPEVPVYESTRNITVTADNGANLRTSPDHTARNIVRAVVKGTSGQTVGFGIGTEVDGNNLWWKLKDGSWIWSGATNVVPTLPSDPTPSNPPANPVTGKTKEELEADLEIAKDTVNKLVDSLKKTKLDLEKSDANNTELATKLAKAQEGATNVLALQNVNTELSKKIELQELEKRELKKDLDNSIALAFEGWELIEIPAGIGAIAKLPLIALKLWFLIKGAVTSGYVVGWKKGAKIYTVSEDAGTPA